MSGTEILQRRAVELRRAFDRSFAVLPPEPSQDTDDILAIRVAGDAWAVPLRDIDGVVAGRRVVPVPAAAPDLLGLAGIRGGVIPVFGLASILGYARDPDSPRWMILCGGTEPLALAFSDFEGHVRLPKSAVRADQNSGATGQHVRQVADTAAGTRAVVSISWVLATLRDRNGHPRPDKEP